MYKSLTHRKNSTEIDYTNEPKINQLLINQKKFTDSVLQKIEENSLLLINILKKIQPNSMMSSFTTFPKRSLKRLISSFDGIKKMIESFNNRIISATYKSSSLTRSSKLSEVFKMTSTKSTLTRDDFAPILILDSMEPPKIQFDVKVSEISPSLDFVSDFYTAVSCSDAKPPQELTVKTYFGYHLDNPEHVRYTQKSKNFFLEWRKKYFFFRAKNLKKN